MQLIPDDAIAVVTILQEAEGEPYAGKLAVAEVIRNRSTKHYNSDGTIIGTCLAQIQFSGWNGKSNNRIRTVKCNVSDPVVMDCMKAWQQAKLGSDTVKGAVLYYSPSTLAKLNIAAPEWADPSKSSQVSQVGHHLFFVPLVS